MDTKDIIYDIFYEFIRTKLNMRLVNQSSHAIVCDEEIEELSEEICQELGICEYCGAKLKGDRNEQNR